MIQEDATLASPSRPPVESALPASGHSFRQWYLVIVLTGIYVLNYVDRGALNLIVNPIKEDLHVSDVQMSLLLGLSFATLYSLLSIPAGYLADIVNRRAMLGSAIFFWSCMASMCGFAGSYWQLFAGRVGLGVGEAALPPTAFSLIRDGVPPVNRGRAFALYQMGPLLGGGIGALVGGSLFALGASGALHGVPIVGGLRPWQLVIVVPALAGIPLSLLLLTVREPPRSTPTTGKDTPTFRELFSYIGQNWRLYVPLFLATTISPMAASGWSAWMPTAIGRSWGLPTAQIGHMIGSIAIVVLPINAIAMGYLMDRLSKGRSPHIPLIIAIVSSCLHLVPAVLVLAMPSPTLMWISYGTAMLLGAGPAGHMVLAYITPGRLMGKTTSLYYLVANLFGLALGPTVYALISAHFFSGPRAIAYSIMTCYPVLLGLATLLNIVLAIQIRDWYRTHGGERGGAAPL